MNEIIEYLIQDITVSGELIFAGRLIVVALVFSFMSDMIANFTGRRFR